MIRGFVASSPSIFVYVILIIIGYHVSDYFNGFVLSIINFFNGVISVVQNALYQVVHFIVG